MDDINRPVGIDEVNHLDEPAADTLALRAILVAANVTRPAASDQ